MSYVSYSQQLSTERKLENFKGFKKFEPTAYNQRLSETKNWLWPETKTAITVVFYWNATSKIGIKVLTICRLWWQAYFHFSCKHELTLTDFEKIFLPPRTFPPSTFIDFLDFFPTPTPCSLQLCTFFFKKSHPPSLLTLYYLLREQDHLTIPMFWFICTMYLKLKHLK